MSPALTSYQGTGTLAAGSQQTRPLWFDGRFLAARDLVRDQSYFLQRQKDLGVSAGFGVIHGLQVTTPVNDSETIVIAAGQGLTPGGDLVMLADNLTIVVSDLADEENLDVDFGVSTSPTPVARTRTGLFVLALRPVQFTANPITSYPVSIQGTRTTHDGNIVEATVVSLIPYPAPPDNNGAVTQQASVARQIFVNRSTGPVSDSLLPIAMVSLQRDVIVWVDQWMVRRDSGPEFGGLRLGLNDPAACQAYLLQYDAQLLQIVGPLANKRFAATDYFTALPPAGRFPLACIDASALTQYFFPQQTNVLLSLVPDDELPALLEESQSLLPIDLTQPASSFGDLSVFMLVPVSRQAYATNAPSLPPVALTGALPQVLNNRKPLELLNLFRFLPIAVIPEASAWQKLIDGETYGYYVRRRSVPVYLTLTTVALTAVPGAAAGALTLTASVSPETATGTITFMDGSTKLGAVAMAQASGSLPVTGLAAGSHSLTAVYSGDDFFATCTSAILQQTV